MAVISMVIGMTSAVISAARKLPSSRNKHDDDQQRALGKVLLDRGDGRVDQLGAVEHGLDDDVRRQRSVDRLHLFIDGRRQRCGCCRP